MDGFYSAGRGSGAHATYGVGRCAAFFRDAIGDEADFLEAVRGGHYHREDRRALIESGLAARFITSSAV